MSEKDSRPVIIDISDSGKNQGKIHTEESLHLKSTKMDSSQHINNLFAPVESSFYNSLEENQLDTSDLTNIHDKAVHNSPSLKLKKAPINFNAEIDVENHRFPFCIVWTPFPLITSLFPPFGHVGVGASDGEIHDFSISNCVSINDMNYGWPYKYLQLELNMLEKMKWDTVIERYDIKYTKKSFDFFGTNCHSYVANILNSMGYKGRKNYTKKSVMDLINKKGKFINKCYCFKIYCWSFSFIFLIITLIIIIFSA